MYRITENVYKCTELLKMVIMYRTTENVYKCTELLKMVINVQNY